MTAARGPGKPRALSPEQESMVSTLRREGFGVAPIAEVFGVSPRTLHAILRREGVATNRGRRRLTVAQESELLDLVLAGWSERKLCTHFGISRDTVRATIRRERPTE